MIVVALVNKVSLEILIVSSDTLDRFLHLTNDINPYFVAFKKSVHRFRYKTRTWS